jgi:hypothetical protein
MTEILMNKHIIAAFIIMPLLKPAFAQDDIQYEDQKFKASNANEFSFFGVSMDIEQDTAIIGSMFHTHSGKTDAGAAYVFDKNNENIWVESAYLTASDAMTSDKFGRSSAISSNTLLIGSPDSQINESDKHGKSYVFEKINNTWTESQIIEYTGNDLFSLFGNEVDLNEQFLFISAPSEFNAFGASQGALYIYEKTNNLWTFSQKITPPVASVGGTFGARFSVTNNLLVITSSLEETQDGIQRGAVYIYTLDDLNTWQLEQSIKPDSKLNQYGYLGTSTNKDQVIIRSTIGNIPPNVSYHLNIYSYINNNWETTASISPPGNEFMQGAILGLKTNDNHMLVSAAIDEDDTPEYVVIHLYKFINEQWIYNKSYLPSDSTVNSGFGFSYSVTDTDILIGSYLEDTIEDDSGAVYRYDLDPIFSNSFE